MWCGTGVSQRRGESVLTPGSGGGAVRRSVVVPFTEVEVGKTGRKQA